MNLYLDSNKISSINLLEGSEWFYNFQVFTIRNNSINEVNILRFFKNEMNWIYEFTI